jgi:hypothetical protein
MAKISPVVATIEGFHLIITFLIVMSLNFCTFLLLGQEPPKPLRFLERVEKAVPRPPTPTVPCPPPGLEEMEQAVVLLQRIIRGRAVQNKVRIVKMCIYFDDNFPI